MRTVEEDILEYLVVPFNMFKSRQKLILKVEKYISTNPKWKTRLEQPSRGIDISDLTEQYEGTISSDYTDNELHDIIVSDIKEIISRNLEEI